MGVGGCEGGVGVGGVRKRHTQATAGSDGEYGGAEWVLLNSARGTIEGGGG